MPVEQSEKGPKREFDPMEKDCFGPFINLTDRQVTTLILTMSAALDDVGEYDQNDVVTLDWDKTRDLCAVADRLWRFVLGERQ